MISLAKPTLKQQAEIAIQTELGGWFANAKFGSELHRAGTLKNNRENYNKLRQSLLSAVAHLPVSVETFWEGSDPCEGSEFHYKITENQGG